MYKSILKGHYPKGPVWVLPKQGPGGSRLEPDLTLHQSDDPNV